MWGAYVLHLKNYCGFEHRTPPWLCVRILNIWHDWFSTVPLSHPILTYCQSDSWDQTSLIFESIHNYFYAIKCIGNCCLQNGDHFVLVTFQTFLSLMTIGTTSDVQNVRKLAGFINATSLVYVNGFVKDCSISIALAMEILQSCTEPSMCVVSEINIHSLTLSK